MLGVPGPAALARFRIAAHALYRFKARPVTSVPTELTGENDSDEILTQALSADVIDQRAPFGLT